MTAKKILLFLITALIASVFSACGGSGGGGGGTALPLMIDSLGRSVPETSFGRGNSHAAGADGSAGDGLPIPNALVMLKDNAGNTATATTDSEGYYRVSIEGFTPPFVVSVVRANGSLWYSPSVTPVKTRGFVTINLTGLTDKISSNLASTLGLSGGAAAITPSILNGNAATLVTVTANFISQFATQIINAGLDPSTFNPVSSPYQAVASDNYDKLIESLNITKDPTSGITSVASLVLVRPQVRQQIEFNPAYPNQSFFRSGLQITITPDTSLFDSARVTGLGLPTLGLWYFYQSNQPYALTLANERSSTPISTFTAACSGCSAFAMTRTQGLTGALATNYAANGTQGNWSKASDGSFTGSSGLKPTKGAIYTFTLYKLGVPYKTVTTTLTADMVDATNAVNLAWHSIGTQSTAALDPTNSSLNGPLTSIPVDWVQNSAAEKVNNVWFSQADGGYDNYTPFTIGATLVVVTPAPGTTFTDLTLPYSDSGPFTGYREIGLGYLTVDGTEKSTAFDYDK